MIKVNLWAGFAVLLQTILILWLRIYYFNYLKRKSWKHNGFR